MYLQCYIFFKRLDVDVRSDGVKRGIGHENTTCAHRGAFFDAVWMLPPIAVWMLPPIALGPRATMSLLLLFCGLLGLMTGICIHSRLVTTPDRVEEGMTVVQARRMGFRQIEPSQLQAPPAAIDSDSDSDDTAQDTCQKDVAKP